MNGQQLIKWGFGLWIGYQILKAIDSTRQAPSNNVNSSNPIPGSLDEYNAIHHPQQLPQPNRNISEFLANLDMEGIFMKAFDKVFKEPILLDSQIVKPSPDLQTLEAGNWIRLIPHPSIVLILGKRGGGKSALGYRLLENLRWTASPYVVGLPENARKLLPDVLGMVASLEDVPLKAIVLVDEAYLPYHARSSMAAEAKALSQMINLSRQREQTLIFVSQEARQVDRNIASSANVVIFKDLGILQLKFDRRELNEIATSAKQAFATITGDKRRWAFVYSPDTDFMGLMENSLPTFWTKKLSHIFAAGGEVMARSPKKMPLRQRIERAKELRRQELSIGQISKIMGVSKATIKNYLDNYPYKK
jgi:hypothetical protein